MSLALITIALGCQTVGFVIVAFISRAQVARLVDFVLIRDYEGKKNWTMDLL